MHADVGSYASAQGVERMLSIGTLAAHATAAFGANGSSFASAEQLARAIAGLLREPVSILFKGSRGAAMETVIEAALEHARSQAAPGGCVAGRSTTGVSATDGSAVNTRQQVRAL